MKDNEKLKLYWRDVNANLWSASKYSEEEARRAAGSLINCHACLDCENCKDCICCVRCNTCLDCDECTDCKNAVGLEGKTGVDLLPKPIEGREEPVVLTWSDEDHNSWDVTKYTKAQAEGYANTLYFCATCLDCKDCKECDGCINCTGCISCSGYVDTVDYDNSWAAREAREKEQKKK